MPRGRWLKPEFFRDRKMAELGPIGAIVYQAVWVIADDGGVAPCDIDQLKGEMFFAWSVIGVPEVRESLRRLFALSRVKFFQAGDELFCQIINWDKHQQIHKPSQFRYRDHYAKQGKEFREVEPEWCSTSGETAQQSPPPRLLDTKTTRHSRNKRHHDKTCRAETAPQADRGATHQKAAGPESWLKPYWEAWVSAYGGNPSGGQLARFLKQLHDRHGPDKTLKNWQNYVASTEAPYASPSKFATTFGSWSKPRPNGKRDPRDPMPGETADQLVARLTVGSHG